MSIKIYRRRKVSEIKVTIIQETPKEEYEKRIARLVEFILKKTETKSA